MNELAGFLISTGGAATALVTAALWLWRRPASAGARRFLIVVAAVYAAASAYVVPGLVDRVLAAGYHEFTAADAPSGPVALVVLGSGALMVNGWDGHIDLMTDIEAARVLEAARVFRLIDPAVVISSGGLPSDAENSQPSGQNMRDELVRLGLPPDRIVVETRSRNTHEEAVVVTPMLRSRGIDHVVLVTSNAHMRRALGAFRAFGWQPVPAIAPDPSVGTPVIGWLVPSSVGLELSRQVSREVLGLPYYWMRGWWK